MNTKTKKLYETWGNVSEALDRAEGAYHAIYRARLEPANATDYEGLTDALSILNTVLIERRRANEKAKALYQGSKDEDKS